MKKLVAAFFLLSVSFANAQQVSNFKYVIVPNTFIDFEKEDYQLNTYLKTLLRQKKYEIVVEGSNNIPSDLQQNECLATRANIQNVKSSFQNKLKVVFTDCNNSILNELDGVSKLKDFEKGYQAALAEAMNKLPEQKFTTTNSIKKETVEVSTNDTNLIQDSKTNKKVENKPIDVKSIKSKKSVDFTDGLITITVNYKENGSIVITNETTLIANFKPTLRPNVFLVSLKDSKNQFYNSIGYTTDETISFEYLDHNNQLKERIFNKVK